MMKSVLFASLVTTSLAAGTAAAQPGIEPIYEPPAPEPVYTPPAPEPVYAPVYAPPVPAPPAPPAPQNEDWNNVSHINGQVVPVGERGDYLYKAPKTNIASNPIGWMMGFYGISISQAVGTNVALRGDANLVDVSGSSTKGYELGASLPIYFKRVYHGPFIEPGLIVREFDERNDEAFGDQVVENRATVGPSVVFGWHWTFDSGLNVAAAFGLMRDMNRQQMEYDSDSDLEPSGYFRVGYAL